MSPSVFTRLSRAMRELRTRRPPDLKAMFPEATALDLKRLTEVRPFTMTGWEKLWSLRAAVKYVVSRGISGDFAEAGVWRGGSSMLAAHSLLDFGAPDRTLWLFDTFEGMPAPTSVDIQLQSGQSAQSLFEARRTGADSSAWCLASLDDVKANMSLTRYPQAQIKYVVGKTQDTLPKLSDLPTFALVRLDTDWYESTRAELEALFHRLNPGGVLIVDDYGHWAGSQRAVDEFFGALPEKYLFHRIDKAGRIMVKA